MSALGFGASWDLSNADRDAVRAMLTFLEDRRVLYVGQNFEVSSQVERSVHEIRKRCTDALSELSERAPARKPIQAIRAACRKFLEEPAGSLPIVPLDTQRVRDQFRLFTALGELRARIGTQIAELASYYEIELEPELASILPPDDADGTR